MTLPAEPVLQHRKVMNSTPIGPCTICGEEKSAGQVWFLVTEVGGQDRLKILHWNDHLAHRWGIHRACSPAHVQELVAHWMVNGSLDDLFAAVEVMAFNSRASRVKAPVFDQADIRGAREIAELSVDRNSIQRVLNENPDSLNILMNELWDTLQLAMAQPALESGMNTYAHLRPV
jgi:hypothetical protein